MRVIAGIARRVRLEIAPRCGTRPFLEVARGALFNHLDDALAGAAVLDLYAGSGALGIEALSRGAASCIFVERDRAAVRVLEENLRRCGLREQGRVIPGAVTKALARMQGEGRFELVFVDPPFSAAPDWETSREGAEVTHHVARLLVPGGRVVFRVPCETDPPSRWRDLRLSWERVHGRSRICVYATMEAGARVHG